MFQASPAIRGRHGAATARPTPGIIEMMPEPDTSPGRPVPAQTLSALERVSGLVAGPQPGLPLRLPRHGGRSPRAALEDAVLDSLRHPPCVVSFSGGRDSSAVLATAVAVARREGLPDPIPVSLRFSGVASTDETTWQELVIRHVGVTDWQRIEVGSDLDLLGDIACASLRRHGLLWPPNAHFHEPMFALARGGHLLTGLDGDGLLGAWRWARAQSVLMRRTPIRPRDVLRVALAVSPSALRQQAIHRQPLPPVTWLRPRAQRAFERLWVRETAAEPRRWDRRITWYSGRRYLFLAKHSLGVLAVHHGCTVRHPLTDPVFLAAMAHSGGAVGWPDRTSAMAALVGDLLPKALVERRGKAEFGRAFWGERARAFAASWNGTGVDGAMADADLLRAAWSAPNPWFASITPLHAAWLACDASASRADHG